MKGLKNLNFGIRSLAAWLMITLLSVASLAAPGGDRRLADALKEGDKETAGALLKDHVDVNATQEDGTTALSWAAYGDDLEMVELLIRAGADVNAANDYGVTALSLACTNRNAAMIEKLLQAGADPNASLRTGGTPLMTCARTGTVDGVKSLLSFGADVNAKETQRGQTTLMMAAAGKQPKVALVLIESGAEIHARSKGGFTALQFASQQGDVDSARMLLSVGANVNEATPDGMSPLLVASASGHEALSILLLEEGADPNAANRDGITALHYALLKGLSTASGVRFDPAVAHWFRPNMLELVEALLAHGANPNARIAGKPAGATPFLLAAVTYDVSAMRALSAGGADPLLASKTNATPLMMAAGLGRREDRTEEEEEKRSLEAVKLAVELGADVNATDEIGQTALHAAAYTGSDAIIQFLADHGANVNVQDKYGQTPLSIAEVFIPETLKDFGLRPFIVHKSTANLLLQLGATPLPVSAARSSDQVSANPIQ